MNSEQLRFHGAHPNVRTMYVKFIYSEQATKIRERVEKYSWQNLSKGRRSLLSILNVYYGAIENIYEDRILKTDKFWTFHITGNLFKKWSKNNYLLYTCI